MKKLTILFMILASPVFAQSPVMFKQGSLMTITNNAANTNGIQLQAEMVDSQQPNRTAKLSAMRELAVQAPIRLVGTAFQGTIKDTNFWNETSVSGGVVTQSQGQVILYPSTNAAGSITYTSVRQARYLAGSMNFYRAVVRLPVINDASVSRWWGATDSTYSNGAAFFMLGTNLYTCTMNNGVTTTNTSFNVAPFAMDTNVHTYEVWWSNSKVWYYIDDVLRHTYSASSAPWTSTMQFSACQRVTSTGSTNNATMNVRVASIYRFGQEQSAPAFYHISGAATATLKWSAGTLHKVSVNAAGTLCTLYDGTNGTGNVIGILDINKTTGQLGTLQYDCPFFTALSVVTTGSGDITVIYE